MGSLKAENSGGRGSEVFCPEGWFSKKAWAKQHKRGLGWITLRNNKWKAAEKAEQPKRGMFSGRQQNHRVTKSVSGKKMERYGAEFENQGGE